MCNPQWGRAKGLFKAAWQLVKGRARRKAGRWQQAGTRWVVPQGGRQAMVGKAMQVWWVAGNGAGKG